jgi:hypothetical protein
MTKGIIKFKTISIFDGKYNIANIGMIVVIIVILEIKK